MHYDEPHYMMEVKFWKDVIGKRADLMDAVRAGRLNADYLEQTVDGLPPTFTPKPLHSLGIALFSLATGLNEDWVGSLWSALLGSLTIGIVGGWTSRYFLPSTAILASLLCAISRSHVMYSRSQMGEADAMFVMLCAVCLHASLALQSRRGVWPAVGTGILYGIAIGINYRCVLVLPIVCLWDIWLCANTGRRLASLCAGIGVVVAFIELPYQIYLWNGGNLPPGMTTYVQGFWNRLFLDLPDGKNSMESFVRPHTGMFASYLYLDWFWWAGGMILGLWATLRTKCPVRRLVCLMAWLPPIGFSLVTRGDGPRAVMTSIPFFVILAAVGWMEYYKWFEEKRVPAGIRKTVGGLIACLLILGACGAWRETRVESAWPAAGRWLVQEQPRMVYTTNPLAVRFYLRKDKAELIPMEDTAVATPGLWVIDRYQAAYSYPFAVLRTLAASHKPEQVFEGRVYPHTGLFLDWGNFMRSGNWRDELKRERMADIEVYRVP